MTQETAAKLVEQNLTAIYGYAYDKLYNKSEAEDLSQEIVIEILRSAENLKTDAAFWGFVWKIAENTFRKYIRREKLINQSLSIEGENLSEVIAMPFEEESDDRDEQIYRLRRELSLLGRLHRDICISYYIKNQSCSSIAKEQNISLEMVKQHLFKARKLLKEGMKMERKLGEKSYNPGTFRLNFWGNINKYDNVCKSKLSGAIVLAAYNNPMTPEEISVELGVAMPYLEEELETLDAAGILIKRGKKYETNIVIIPEKHDKELEKETAYIYAGIAEKVFTDIKNMLVQIRALDFKGNTYDDNRLLFALCNIAFMNGCDVAHEMSPIGQPQKLPLDCCGWIYGHDNNCENVKFMGIAGHAGNKDYTAWFSAENYKVLLSAQNFIHKSFRDKVEGMCDAILEKEPNTANETLPYLIENGFVISSGGRLSANFPVFREKVLNELSEILSPASDEVGKCMIEVSDKAEALLLKTTPKFLHHQCSDIAKIHHRLNVAAYLMEALVSSGKLIIPKEKTPLCIYGVIK